MKDQHQKYMQRCLELAVQAAAMGESAVGSIVVKDGLILGEGFEQSRQLKDVTRHAEVVAILNAIHHFGSCAGATLYSNAEPCVLCSYVIRHYQIAAVVFSDFCGELGGTNARFNILTADINAWKTPPTVTVYPPKEQL